MDYWLIRFETPITILLVIIGLILVLMAQAKINSAYSKYRKIKNKSGLTGAEVARKILNVMNKIGPIIKDKTNEEKGFEFLLRAECVQGHRLVFGRNRVS